MNKRYWHIFFTAVMVSLLIIYTWGCSKEGEQPGAEKGTIDKMTDQAAETAVKKIRTPQDKARALNNIGDERLEEMDKV
ncbi:MAG: hypothetical protein R3297_11320, partial [Desulfobulbales bacterium]|nr:hypothetical protein [Desulfobulbales bacterium]